MRRAGVVPPDSVVLQVSAGPRDRRASVALLVSAALPDFVVLQVSVVRPGSAEPLDRAEGWDSMASMEVWVRRVGVVLLDSVERLVSVVPLVLLGFVVLLGFAVRQDSVEPQVPPASVVPRVSAVRLGSVVPPDFVVQPGFVERSDHVAHLVPADRLA